MPTQGTLFDLFGDFGTAWPVDVVREQPGYELHQPSSPAPWLNALDHSVRLSNIRTGAAPGGRVAVEADVRLPVVAAYPDGWPFVMTSMPDVEFRIQQLDGAESFAQLFASVSDSGAEIVVEGLPVEIRLPPELIEPHPTPDDHPSGIEEMTVGDFTAGSLDDLKIVYRRGNPTSIFVHVRLHATEDGEFDVQPAVPISFGKCVLSGIPCLAVHDFRLVPSPELARDTFEWIRHSVRPFLPEQTGGLDGLFAIRHVHVDPDTEPLKGAADWLNKHGRDIHPTAELVLDDLVVPFFAPYVVPVPRHATVGIRRNVLDPGSEAEVFSFERAPVHADFTSDTLTSLVVESLFYRSLPAEDLERDLGLTFRASIVFGEEQSDGLGSPPPDAPQQGIEITLAEDYTVLAGYRRDFSSSTGMPAPGTGAAATLNRILHWEIAANTIDVMALRAGLSLGRFFGEGKSFLASAEATVDVFVSMPPTGDDTSFFRLRSLNGEKTSFAAEGLGWRQGSVHLEGASLPDGVVAYLGPFGLVISELGLVADQGATYLSFSGGVIWKRPAALEEGLTFRRLRFRVVGDDTHPPVKLDGFFALISTPRFRFELGGYYTDQTVDSTRVREAGLAGSLTVFIPTGANAFGVDLIFGNRQSPTEDFDYFLVHAFFRGTIPIFSLEVRSARILYANDMRPKLDALDLESRELRYYNWHKKTNPLFVPGDRRLTAWQAENGADTIGIGAGVTVAGFGKLCELDVFVMYLDSPSEHGWLIAAELFALGNKKPLAFAVVEWDERNDRISIVAGVELTLEHFLKDPPEWSKNLAKVTGTVFFTNDPGVFAIGRLSDEATWAGIRFDIDLWLRTFIQFAACIEYVNQPEGPKGFGLVVRIEGGIKAGVVRATYNAGFGVVVMTFQTGSSDYAAVVFIEAGFRIVLFGFLRIGVSAKADFRTVGTRPTRGELRLRVKLETPWFLPDVTWTLEVTFGELEPAGLATAVSPLRTAAATTGAERRRLPVHVERFDQAWNGDGTAPTHSVNELRAAPTPEATRLAQFEADAEALPIPVDATIAIEWSVAVNDQLGLGGNVAPGLGDQSSGDLTLSYDLVGLAVRRRARFGPDRAWKPLQETIALPPDFSDPNGVDLSGSFGPQELTALWDLDTQIAGQPATKKLLVNAVAPFEFATSNPEVDEGVVKDHPEWPCCPRDHGKPPFGRLHQVDFRGDRAGISLGEPRRFSDSQSRLRFLRPAWVRPALAPGLPPAARVAAAEARPAGALFRAELDEDAAFCFVRLARPREGVRVAVVAFDAAGSTVAERELGPGPGSFETITIPGQGPIRRLEARLVGAATLAASATAPRSTLAVEVDWVAYIGLRDYLDGLVRADACEGGTPGSGDGFEGHGKLFFLPNHDYELKLTTRVTVAHPSTSPESADVEEFLYFRTKGLPGLNAVQRAGEELERYVAGAYAGGRGALYREEPVTLAFHEGFAVAIPLELRPPGGSAERTTLMRLQLLVQPEVATSPETPVTSTGTDWIVAHRGMSPPPSRWPWRDVVSLGGSRGTPMRSVDPLKVRLAGLTQRPEVTCGLSDPRDVSGTVLIAPPQGEPDPADPARELWPGPARFTARVRREGAGFVHRRPFEPGDETALAYPGPGGGSAWSVADGELRVDGDDSRRFAVLGEADWNHLSIHVALGADAAAAGVGVGLPAGTPSSGLFALVEENAAGRRLAVYRREAGGAFTELGSADVAAGAAGTPAVLEVTSFDDRLRASVGEAVVEVDRDEIREGRLCLVADGPASFTALHVAGLDLYAFPFAVSRFRSFEDHIGSFEGAARAFDPSALGSAATSTVASLWAATGTEVADAMRPDGDTTARQALFDRWVREQALPLTDDVTRLEISRLADGDKTALLLLESPEPFDFTEEIGLQLTRRIRVLPPRPPRPPLDPVLGGRRALRAEMARLGHEGALPEEPEPSRTETGPASLIRDVVSRGDGLRIELEPPAARRLVRGARLVVAEILDGGAARVYTGRVSAGPPVVDALPSEDVSLPPKLLAGLEPGTIVLVNPALDGLIDVFPPHWVDVPVDAAVLQDAPGKRALIVPLTGTAAWQLPQGRYRLRFTLDRARWQTEEPPDDTNRYQAEATLGLTF